MPDSGEANLDGATPPDNQPPADNQVDDFAFQDDNSAPPVVSKPAQTPVTPTEGEDDLDDDKKIQAAVQASVAPVLESLSPLLADREAQKVTNEWEQIVKDYPEAKGMENKVKRWATTEGSVYKGDVKGAFQAIAGTDFFIKVGAKRAKAAEKESNEDKGGGGTTPRPSQDNNGGVSTDATDLRGKSPAEINKIINAVKSGRHQASI